MSEPSKEAIKLVREWSGCESDESWEEYGIDYMGLVKSITAAIAEREQAAWKKRDRLWCEVLELHGITVRLVPEGAPIQIVQTKAVEAAREKALGEAFPFSHHGSKCKAFPAISDEQILRDCDCGFVKLFKKAYFYRTLAAEAERGDK